MKIKQYLNEIHITSNSIQSQDYLKLGISEEFGEILGNVKRYCRGDFGKEGFREQMKKEIGDLIYYLAVYEERIGQIKEFREPRKKGLKTNLHNLMALNANIFNAKHPRHLTLAIHNMVDTATDLAYNFNLTMDEITQANVDNIRSRFNRNMIRGSGDER